MAILKAILLRERLYFRYSEHTLGSHVSLIYTNIYLYCVIIDNIRVANVY